MRDYIRSHSDYKLDSHVSESIMYDLAMTCDGISRGSVQCPALFGHPNTKSINVTLPKCVKVKQEVDLLTEKIIMMEKNPSTENKLADNQYIGTEFENQLGRSLGVGVKSGSASVQM